MTLFRLLTLVAVAPALLGWAVPGSPGRGAPGGNPPGLAQPVAEQDVDKAGLRLVELFARFCLNRFPNQPDLAGGEPAMEPMPPGMIQRYLHADPGRGWINREDGDTVVTIEDPPYHACAVRRIYPAAPRFGSAYQQAISQWAAQQRRDFGPIRPAEQRRPNMHIQAIVQTLPAAAGKLAENLMAFTTTYPSGNVEIRLVRQIPDRSLPPGSG